MLCYGTVGRRGSRGMLANTRVQVSYMEVLWVVCIYHVWQHATFQNTLGSVCRVVGAIQY